MTTRKDIEKFFSESAEIAFNIGIILSEKERAAANGFGGDQIAVYTDDSKDFGFFDDSRSGFFQAWEVKKVGSGYDLLAPGLDMNGKVVNFFLRYMDLWTAQRYMSREDYETLCRMAEDWAGTNSLRVAAEALGVLTNENGQKLAEIWS